MADSNPLFGPGSLDREREPHCCLKMSPMVISHYEGFGGDTIITAICPLYGCCIWSPSLKRGAGDIADPQSEENPLCCFGSKGAFDRERKPHFITRCCAGQLATCQYDGCFSMANILAIFCGFLYTGCLWEPTLRKGGLLGAPIQAGGYSGQMPQGGR